MATNKTIGTLLLRIEADAKALRKGMQQTQKSVQGLKKSFNVLAGTVIAAFSVQAIVGFTKEAIRLAGQMEGVQAAFSRLPESTRLLEKLRKATRNTVTDLQLMKYAVQAKNFKIPINQLATYFEFATKRAAQTGESVDYLVQSIITGIGRKSVLIMDNLGISALELRDRFKEMGDFGAAAGAIIREELGSMGDVSVTTAQQIEALGTAWENFKVKAGTRLIGVLKEAKKVAQDIKKIYDLIPKYAPGEFGGKKEPITGPRFEKVGTERRGFVRQEPISTDVIFLKREIPGLIDSIDALTITSDKYEATLKRINEAGLKLADTTLPEMKTEFADLGIVIQQAFVDAGSALGEFLGDLMTAKDEMVDFGDIILQSFGNFAVQMGELLIAYGAAMLAFNRAKMNPYAAIAAGIALVAIGTAISNLAASGPSGAGGQLVTYGSSAAGPGMGPQRVQVEGVIKGKDLHLVQTKYYQSAGRM